MGRLTLACNIIFCLVLILASVSIIADTASALSGGEVCRSHIASKKTNDDQTWCRASSWCGVGQSSGCSGVNKQYTFTNPARTVWKFDDGLPGFLQYDDRCCQPYDQGWKPKGSVNLLKSVDFNVPAPYRKAAISHVWADDAVSVWVNDIEVARAGKFREKLSDGSIRTKKYTGSENPPFPEAIGCRDLDPPINKQINKDITSLNAVREGANNLKVYGCYGGASSFPNAWARLCFEYGEGSPSGSGCVAPVTCTPRTDAQLCSDNGFTCGTHTVLDNCDVSRTISCGGACPPACTPDTAAECAGKCNTITDSCGNPLDCGSCSQGTCGLYTTNECGCQATGSCNGDTYEQTNSDCSVYAEACNPSIQQCTPTGCECTITDEQFCQGPPKRCGIVPQATDACGNERYDISCGNTCTLSEECISNQCQTCAITDPNPCGSQQCGSVTIIDSCNRPVSISCGECLAGQFCGTNQGTGAIECQVILDDPHLQCDIRNKVTEAQPAGAVCLTETSGVNNAHANQCTGTFYSHVNECTTPLDGCSMNCAQRDGGCNADEFEVVEMSGSTNAHGARAEENFYSRSVCCKVTRDAAPSEICAILTCETQNRPGQLCTAGNTQVIRLSDVRNAHFGEDGNYPYVACCDIATPCEDGIDNDGDGFIDWNGGFDAQGFPVQRDPGCTSQDDTTETDDSGIAECDDGIDNDGDGLMDYRVVGGDPGCESPLDLDETDPDVVEPVCEADCTYESDSTCHVACNGVNGCAATGVADICDDLGIGTTVPVGNGNFAICCSASESFPPINGSGLGYDTLQDRIRSTRIRQTDSGFTRVIIVDSFK